VVYSCLFQLIAIPKAKMMAKPLDLQIPTHFLLRQGSDGRVDGNRFGPQLPLYQALQDCQRLLPFQGLFTGGQQRVEGHYVLRNSGFFLENQGWKNMMPGVSEEDSDLELVRMMIVKWVYRSDFQLEVVNA
jgi:hypothetical protein